MRKSKYLGMVSGQWVCTHVGVARVQPTFYKGTRTECLRPGHQSYYYIFERMTSDNKAEKMIRLNNIEAAKVWKKKVTVEEISDRREKKQAQKFARKISYHFIDRIKR
jgi:hypothetical protein